MKNVEIPLSVSIVSGQDQQKVDEKIFGKFSIKDKPGIFKMGKEKEIQYGIKIKKKNYYLREAIDAWQDINIYLEIPKTISLDSAIDLTALYLYDVLKEFKTKITVGIKHIPIKPNKEETIKVLKEEILRMYEK